ncbi:MAG: DUF2857 domain-containing protein [Candidatus Accumulibacter sp.]|nr:DUF2857 domain-containing protein [Accumulibacter sp.]
MPAPHPLNQAVLTQALHDLRNGQLHRCLEMGFGEHELEVLKQPALIALLANAQVPWCSVKVNRNLLWRLVGQMRDIAREVDAIDRMLRLGASTELVSKHHGLTHQEVALRREILGLPKRKGRHPTLDEAGEAELWQHWKAAVAEHGVALDDEDALLERAMELAESMSQPLSVIWATLKNWIDQGLV